MMGHRSILLMSWAVSSTSSSQAAGAARDSRDLEPVADGLDLLTLRPDLRQPPWAFTVDPERSRRSMRRLAELEPEVAYFGHGPVIAGAAPRLKAVVDAL